MADAEDKESLARAHLPYRAEYCKTSRAKCKKCQEKMEANSLKLAYLTKSRFHDGYDASYFHVNCFFLVKRPSSVAEISHFETLKYEDQKMLEKAIETNAKSVLAYASKNEEGRSKKGKGKKAAKRASNEDINYQDFLVEYSKSGRAKCCTCQETIPKDVIRFAKMDYTPNDIPGNIGPVPRWHHMECFAKSLEQLEFFGYVEKIPNFNDLEREDRKMLKKTIKPIMPPADGGEDGDVSKRVKKEVDEETEEEERMLKWQSKKFHELRNILGECRKSEIEDLLEHMGQKYNFKASTLSLDLAADVLMFGPLKPCPKCKVPGTMILRSSSYICTNGANSDKPCDYETRDPQRTVPEFPDEFLEKYPYFAEKYELIGGKRIFPKKFLKAVEQKEAENNNLALEGAPLEGLSIGVISWATLKSDKEKIQKKIVTLGGRVTTVIDSSIFVVLSNKNELDKVTPKMEVAKSLELPFAKEDFLFKLKTKEDVVPELSKCIIGEWVGKLKERFEAMSSKSASSSCEQL